MAGGRKTQNVVALEDLLSEVVTPLLRGAGFRKSSHTYRRRAANGDEAAIWFRAWSTGAECSFLLDVWFASEPVWDLGHFDADRARAYPRRTQSYDAIMHRQIGPPPDRWGNWSWSSPQERATVVALLTRLLLDHVLPLFDLLADRGRLLALAAVDQAPVDYRRGAGVYRALLVDAGPSDALDELLLHLNAGEPEDEHFLAWANARLNDGPTWQAITAEPEEQDLE